MRYNIGTNLKLSLLTLISRVISGSIIYIILARLMSVDDYGLLNFGATLAGLLTVFAEFGFSLMAQRDIPQNRFRLDEYVGNVMIQKVGYSFVVIILGILYSVFFYDSINSTIGVIFSLNAILTSFNMYFFAIFRAKNKFKYESVISIIYSISSVLLLAVYYYFNLGILTIAYGLLIIRFLQLLILIIVYFSQFPFVLKIDAAIQKYLFKNSFSFGLHYIIGTFYFTIDNQLIAYYCGNEALAFYQAVFKFVLILLYVTALIESVFLPYLSENIGRDKERFLGLSKMINKQIISVSIILFLFFILFSKHLIVFLYGEKYLPSFSIILPLSFILLLRGANVVYSILLTISDHQRKRALIVFISFIFNVSLNFIIIPKFNFEGAAYVSLLTHILLLFMYVFTVHRVFKSYLLKFNLIFSGSIIVLIVLFLYISFPSMNFAFSIITFVLSIFIILISYSKQELFEIVQLLKKS
ncbi:oligosaccharide flippase family protein [Saccharicrinis sp. FJH2]|uniref:oligosaccharide flippase family protein n=1 Tax=Saccharicrinis sp. FJH65 TaxID=3344659 RepID=UPI0035F24554